ncbi:21607_t:CDS:2, partial [Gigaspora rosea]
MTALPLIATAISSITNYPIKIYNECIAEGLDLNKISDIELIYKYSIQESNSNGKLVQWPTFKHYEENVKKTRHYVETDESVKHDVENDKPEHDVENDEPKLQPMLDIEFKNDIEGAFDYFILTNDYLGPYMIMTLQINDLDQLLNMEINHTNHLTGGKDMTK